MKRTESGFTLIEVLVVVSILGVLMGLVAILVLKAPEKQKQFLTETRISNIQLAIDRFKQEFKFAPPMTVEALAKRLKAFEGLKDTDNGTNTSIEALVLALNHPDFSAKIGESLQDAMGNTDEDSFNTVPPGMGTADARELVDGWDNPIVYIDKNHYDKGPVMIVLADGTEGEVEAWRKADGTWYNPTGYQLISIGRDGLAGNADDVTNFKREETE